MRKSLQRLAALTRKEVTQMLRDRRGLLFIIALPLLQLFLYAYAANTTVYHIPIAIVDQSRDRKSREFVEALVNSQYFNPTLQLQSEAEVVSAIDRGQVKAGLVIPPRFATVTDRGTASVLMVLDGSDSSSVSSGFSAASLVAQNYALQLSSEQVIRKGGPINASTGASALPITTTTRVLYNPDMIDTWFLLPGLVGLLLQTLAVQQAAFLMVRERELGTIEQILVTPARPLELLLSKVIPLLALCILAFGVVLGIGIFWFGVPFHGNLLLYFWLVLLFITSSLSLGLLMSNRAKTQKEALQMTLPLTMFGLLLGGMIYPRRAMPAVPQFIGNLLPMTYFIRISRGIFTKGIGFNFVWRDALALAIYALIVILVTARNLKKRLD
ncbi:MAG: ABC transporter permease [Herpetosiphonaceae bacterium]|nr:ABC transporter permease [Herpetosiphonaceae bacterium]